MREIMKSLVDCLASSALDSTGVITWAAPVPVFGDIENARVATLGINPSNREFEDTKDNELDETRRRFLTLKSLGLETWQAINDQQLDLLLDSCRYYFLRNPYGWFKQLDQVISGTGLSFYKKESCACHLDLVPYATKPKWGELCSPHKENLLASAKNALGLLIKESPVMLLVVNGSGVINELKRVSTIIDWEEKVMPQWTRCETVSGKAFCGTIDTIGGIRLDRLLRVLGYNHNIQRSPGMSGEIRKAIGEWITQESRGIV